MKKHHFALSILLILPLLNQPMDQSSQTNNKIIELTKKFSIQGLSVFKKTWDIVKPTPAQQQIMFSMLFMAGMFALSQAAVNELPDCNYLKGIYGPINKEHYSNDFWDPIEHTAQKNGCADICQVPLELEPPILCDKACMESMNVPTTIYMAKCYGAPHNIPHDLIISHELHKNNDGSSVLKYMSIKSLFPPTK